MFLFLVDHRERDVQIGGEQNPEEVGHHEARCQGGDFFKPDNAGDDCRVQKQDDNSRQPEGAAAEKRILHKKLRSS